jgi:hypothetical protein
VLPVPALVSLELHPMVLVIIYIYSYICMTCSISDGITPVGSVELQ